ncbi:MAG: ABC transporter ATP-binding protein [Burkholderiales bacterium]|nr:MAG: ABC transporter ATP-binding protein [Burkholderiales bacterium]
MLALRNVDVVFDGVIQVLRSLSLDVPAGQIVALMGGNGAGKTTTLKAISSLLAPERGAVVGGRILYGERDLANSDPGETVRAGIVQVMEGRRVLQHLTVEQNLRVGGHFRDDRDEVGRDIGAIYGVFPRLRELRERVAGFLSGGEMQMLLFGRALMARPKLLLLDEPSMGLAPKIVHELFERVLQVSRDRSMSVLLVEQNARAALSISDYGYVMENGRVVLHGTRDELERNEDIREFYLGLGSAQGKRSYRDVKHYRRRKRWLG